MTRPRRLQWLFTLHPVYFITLCTKDRRHILDRKIVNEKFVEFCKAAAAYQIHVGRYVIMPDHIHVFAAFGIDSLSISSWIKSLKNSVSKVLKSANCLPPHWQKGFFEHVIRSQESYERKWEYVRNNPVRAGRVQNPRDWPYSGEISNLEDLRL